MKVPFNYNYFLKRETPYEEIKSYLLAIATKNPKCKIKHLWEIEKLFGRNSQTHRDSYEQLFNDVIGNLTIEEFEQIELKNPTD